MGRDSQLSGGAPAAGPSCSGDLLSAPVGARFGVPLHAATVGLPVGLWVGAVALDLASWIAPEPYTFPRAAYWVVVLGLVACVPVGLVGLVDLIRGPRGTPAWRAGLAHSLTADVAAVAFLVSFMLRRRTDFISAVSPIVLAVSLFGAVLVVGAVVTGSRLSYRFGPLRGPRT